jgi:hypothetical protein
MDGTMKRHFACGALALGAAGCALLLFGCSTTESRISEHPDIYHSLSARNQQLVAQGQITAGMPQSAVYLAWGSPEQKTVGMMGGNNTETWIYLTTTSAPYYGGYGYGYGGGLGYGRGFGYGGGFYGGGIGVIHAHHGHRYFVYGDPFYDPFYFSAIPPQISYPNKTVTFVNGRVVSFQYFVPPYRY